MDLDRMSYLQVVVRSMAASNPVTQDDKDLRDTFLGNRDVLKEPGTTAFWLDEISVHVTTNGEGRCSFTISADDVLVGYPAYILAQMFVNLAKHRPDTSCDKPDE